MRFLYFRNIFSFLIVLVLLTARAGLADQKTTTNTNNPNPHTERSDCSICHVAPVEKLQGFRSWFVSDSTKRELVDEPTTLCRNCHGVSFGHGVGKKPTINKSDLPLTADGTINCALTCHNMHLRQADDETQQRFHLRYPGDQLCASCHDK